MYGMPAVIYGRYGKGRVLVSVAHPEYFPSTHDVLAAGFKPLAGRAITFTYLKKSVRPLRVAYYSSEIDGAGDARKTVEDALSLDARPEVDGDGGSVKRERSDKKRMALEHYSNAIYITGEAGRFCRRTEAV